MNRLAVPFHGRIIGFPYWNKVGGAAPFSPTDIAGLKLWLKSDAGLYQERTGASATTPASADGDPVGSWLDQSGTGNHFTAPSDAARLTLKLAIQNGYASTLFDGTDDYLTGVQAASYQELWFVVRHIVTVPSYATVWNGGAGDSYNVRLEGNTSWRGTVSPADSNDWALGGTFLINGASATTLSVGTTQIVTAVRTSAATIAGRLGFSQAPRYFHGYLIEGLGFSSTLTAGERTKMLSYLNTKYAVY